MNRNPSTSINPVKPQGILPPVGERLAAFTAIFAAGREAFPHVNGLTCIDAGRAFFQKTGDRTFYSVAISGEESSALGYNPTHNRA